MIRLYRFIYFLNSFENRFVEDARVETSIIINTIFLEDFRDTFTRLLNCGYKQSEENPKKLQREILRKRKIEDLFVLAERKKLIRREFLLKKFFVNAEAREFLKPLNFLEAIASHYPYLFNSLIGVVIGTFVTLAITRLI